MIRSVIQIKKHLPLQVLFLGAPLNDELLNLWHDFLKVVDFINDNERWLMPLLKMCKKK